MDTNTVGESERERELGRGGMSGYFRDSIRSIDIIYELFSEIALGRACSGCIDGTSTYEIDSRINSHLQISSDEKY